MHTVPSLLKRWWIPAAALGVGLLGTSSGAMAQSAPAPAIDTGSTAWMLISAALVLFMMPGLALFYGGMVRAKNVLNTFLNVMVCCGVIGVLWVVIGYALVFPVIDTSAGTDAVAADATKGIEAKAADPFRADGTNALFSIGTKSVGAIEDDPETKDVNEARPAVERTVSILGFDKTLIGLQRFSEPGAWSAQLYSGDTDPRDAKLTGVPELVFAMFQGMFAIITPALIVGSIAERVRLAPLLIFLVLWSLIVYCPTAHMVWNVNGFLFQKGVLDFAGGTVVHVLAGVSALALTLVVGPRVGYGKTAMPPHSLGLTLVGAGMLWFGWFGFNAGSAIGVGGADLPVAGGVAALAFATTQTAAAAAALSWMLVEWLKDGKPTILGFASGMVAGLVVITPCAGFVGVTGALFLGLLGGAVCYFGCQLKKVFKYDDTLDAFGVHGVGGALGAVLVGAFCIRGSTAGMEQVLKQLTGLGLAAVFAFVVSLGLALALKYTIGLRASTKSEEEGLDVSLHGETSYNLSIS